MKYSNAPWERDIIIEEENTDIIEDKISPDAKYIINKVTTIVVIIAICICAYMYYDYTQSFTYFVRNLNL